MKDENEVIRNKKMKYECQWGNFLLKSQCVKSEQL